MGVLFRAADDYPADPDLVKDIETQFGITGADVLRYDDRKRGNARHILVRDGKLAAVSLAGDISAEHWLKDYLQNAHPVAALGRLLLMPSAKAPQNFKPRGRIVCNCFDVAESEIADALALHKATSGDAALAGLQQKLKCGTNCGSCLPEVKNMILTRDAKISA
jgi:assimilatory nitrate reductase catalytic subunit